PSPSPATRNRPANSPARRATATTATRMWGDRARRGGRGPEARAPPSSGRLRGRGAATDVVRVAGVPLMGGTHVRELVEERRVVGVHAVAQLVVGRHVEVGRERGAPGQRAQL